MTTSNELPDIMAQNMRGSVEPSFRRVRVKLGEETIAESKSPLLLIQFGPGILPTYFFTHEEAAMDRLTSPVDRNGRRYWALEMNGQRIEDAAWTYINPPEQFADLKDRVTFNWDTLDWYEEDERVFVHARDPHKRVDTLASSRHVQIMIAGEVIADTHKPHLLFETHLPTRYYIPQTDVRMQYLHETSHTSQCPYKGKARYWSAQVGDQTLKNVAWSYPDPIPENPKIKDLISFYNEKVDIYVDGELMPRPVTPWS
jgi:uncharacterized protein (DUF427 family)